MKNKKAFIVKPLLLFAVCISLNGMATEIETTPNTLKEILDAAHANERVDWLHDMMSDSKFKPSDEMVQIALVEAAVELAAKHNDLAAYHYLIQRLVLSDKKEDVLEVASKLTGRPGMEKYYYACAPALFARFEAEESGMLNEHLARVIRTMIRTKPEIAKLYCGKKKALLGIKDKE